MFRHLLKPLWKRKGRDPQRLVDGDLAVRGRGIERLEVGEGSGEARVHAVVQGGVGERVGDHRGGSGRGSCRGS